jgi:hypothetical protein
MGTLLNTRILLKKGCVYNGLAHKRLAKNVAKARMVIQSA